VKNGVQMFFALGKPLHLQKLILSSQHKFTQNVDEPDWYWPPIYFWTKGLNLMHRIEAVLERISSLDAKVQENFWQDSIPAQLLKDFPWLATFDAAQVVEYCRIMQSSRKARSRLIIQARGDRLCPKGTYSKFGGGESKLVEEKFVLNEVAKSKSINHHCYLPQFIFEAAKQNNVRFFIRLGKVLQSREKIPDVDWTRCDPVACFLVENWCKWGAYNPRFPALCFFSDSALADFCSAVFGRNCDNPSVDSIRQWRRRLGLKQPRRPKIRQISLKGKEALFVGC
jgi:hypothetical protein